MVIQVLLFLPLGTTAAGILMKKILLAIARPLERTTRRQGARRDDDMIGAFTLDVFSLNIMPVEHLDLKLAELPLVPIDKIEDLRRRGCRPASRNCPPRRSDASASVTDAKTALPGTCTQSGNMGATRRVLHCEEVYGPSGWLECHRLLNGNWQSA